MTIDTLCITRKLEDFYILKIVCIFVTTYFNTIMSSNIFRSYELRNHPPISTQYVSELPQKEKMSVSSSGMQQQRRKKLENKQKFVFDEKDVVPPLRAAVKKSSVQVIDT